jgi:uncharacterized protein YndB with AHSA1/START domain
MNKGFTAKSAVVIDASVSKVWEALTKPELIRQYMFGAHVNTDWQVGSPITYTGVWEGNAYEDKGTILQVEPEKLLVSTFWSAMSGLPDLPENYQTISYELNADSNGRTVLTVTQDNNPTSADASRSEQNWNMVLDSMKTILEEITIV